MTTLRESLSESFEQAEDTTDLGQGTGAAPTVGAAPVTGETNAAAEARARDQQGRFARQHDDKGSQKNAQVQAAQGAQPAQPTGPRKVPSSWHKDYHPQWERLGSDPELAKLQEYIEKREADFAKGVSTYKNQWEQAQPLYEAMAPLLPELQRMGVQPGQWITNLSNAHRMLAMGNPVQKLQMFAKLASDYGVPLQALTQGRVDPQASHMMNTVNALMQRVNQFENQRQAEEHSVLKQEIDAFKQNAPHFEAVKSTMAGLLQAGFVSDLQSAYDKAIRMNDDVWQQEQARQAHGSATSRQQQIANKKAAAASPRSSSPTGAMAQGNGKRGLRETLSEQFDSAASGHI
jgi:hypothetical protein